MSRRCAHNQAQVIGYDYETYTGCLWQNGVLSELPGAMMVSAINNVGQIAGVTVNNGHTEAAVWRTDGGMTLLGVAHGGIRLGSFAKGINDAGQVVGTSVLGFENPSGVTNTAVHVFLWNGSMRCIVPCDIYTQSDTAGINAAGVAVGQIAIGQYATAKPAIWRDGDMTVIEAEGNVFRGINDAGVCIGNDSLGGGFVWTDGIWTNLGADFMPRHINNASVVVGSAGGKAARWVNGVSEKLEDLLPPDSGWTELSSAESINDLGQIVGSGSNTNGWLRAFLLTPVSP